MANLRPNRAAAGAARAGDVRRAGVHLELERVFVAADRAAGCRGADAAHYLDVVQRPAHQQPRPANGRLDPDRDADSGGLSVPPALGSARLHTERSERISDMKRAFLTGLLLLLAFSVSAQEEEESTVEGRNWAAVDDYIVQLQRARANRLGPTAYDLVIADIAL